MNKHKGYVDINFGALITFLLLAGAVLGVFGYVAVSYAWPYVKSWMHVVTA
jgi:hypothetical protein